MTAPATPKSLACRRAPRAGYSLVELLVALAILAVMVAAAVPRLNIPGYQADGGARVVVGALQGAQRLAIAQQSAVVVGVDLPNNRLRILEDLNANGVRDCPPLVQICERVTWRPLDAPAAFATPPASVTGAQPAAVVNVTQVRDLLPSLSFGRDGAASESGEIYLRARRGTMTEWRGVVVTRATGRVDWYARSTPGGAWKRRSL